MPDLEIASDSPLGDGKLQLQIVVLRWLLTVLYALFVWVGIIDVAPVWFVASIGFLSVYHVYYTWYTWHEFTRPSFPPAMIYAVPFLDTVAISLALIAIGDPLHPIWGVYFFVIIAVGFFYHPIVWPYVFWLVANYAAMGVAVHLRGFDVPIPFMVVAAVILLMGIADVASFTTGERRLRTRLSVVARTDPLTGLSNRRRLGEALEEYLKAASEGSQALAVLMVDIDWFKRYNTQFGHLAADGVLEQLADLLVAAVREEDLVARYGGDEFVVVIPEMDVREAFRFAERLRHQIARSGLCNVSIGVCASQGSQFTGDELLGQADAALLAAKQAGRNCVRASAMDEARAA